MKRNNNRSPVKKNISSTQVLKTLKVLLEDNSTMSELIEKLNRNEDEPVFNNSTVSKYINTCRFCGIRIPKINNKYYVTKMPFGLNFSDKETDLLEYMQDCAKSSLSANANIKFEKTIQTLSRYSNKQIVPIEKGIAENACFEFEKAIKAQKKVKIILKTKRNLECIPLDILEKDQKLYFHIICDGKERNVLSSRVAGIEISKETFSKTQTDNTVIYKLTGNLAKNYNLRENERIVNNSLPDDETIINYNENIPALISRLLRYGELCEVINPGKVRTEIKETINATLANYGE